VYGYDLHGNSHLFEVAGTGEITDQRILRYAVIGSGYWMGSASLRRKPMTTTDFGSVTYRLMEAKFSAETARGVGKSTTVTFKRRGHYDSAMGPTAVDEIRKVWETKMREPEPDDALKIIRKTKGMHGISTPSVAEAS
jgi:hypothetical protein